MFYIVKFQEGDREYVEAVPKSWFNDDVLQYPAGQNVSSLIKNSRPPLSNWNTYPAKIMHAYDTLAKARENLDKALDTSDLNTDVEDAVGGVDRRKRIAAPPARYDETENTTVRTRPRADVNNKDLGETGTEISSSGNKTLPDYPVFCINNPGFNLEENFDGVIFSPEELAEIDGDGSAVECGANNQVSGLEIPLTSPNRIDIPISNGCTPSAAVVCTPKQPGSGIARRNLSSGNLDPRNICRSCEKLTEEVIKMKLLLINMDKKLDVMLYKAPESNPITSEALPGMKQFDSWEEFTEFDKKLTDKDKILLRQLLTRSGGGTYAEAANRMMTKLLTNGAAVSISMKGQKGNHNFSSTTTRLVVIESLVSLPGLGDERKAEKAVSDWLRHASGRQKRASQAQN